MSSSTGTVSSPAWTLRHYRERGGGACDPAAAVPVSAGGFAIESSVSNFVVWDGAVARALVLEAPRDLVVRGVFGAGGGRRRRAGAGRGLRAVRDRP